jgi:hypothetical protein
MVLGVSHGKALLITFVLVGYLGNFVSMVYSQTCSYKDATGTCVAPGSIYCDYVITDLCESPNVRLINISKN